MENDKDIVASLARFRRYGRLKDADASDRGVFYDHDGNEVDPEEVGLNAHAFRGRVVYVSDCDE